MKGIADLDRLAKRFATDKATLEDCVILYDNVEKMKPIITSLSEFTGKNSETLQLSYVNTLKVVLIISLFPSYDFLQQLHYRVV